MVNASCWACVIPAPHLAGSVQVITPPVSVQPWLVSRFLALAGLNGYGPWLLLAFWLSGVHWLAGRPGTAAIRDRVAAPDRGGVAGLVHHHLQRLPDVELLEHRAGLLVVHVRHEVAVAEGDLRRQGVAAAERVARRHGLAR